MPLSRVDAATDFVSRTGYASLVLSSETLVMSGAIGATDNLDIGVAVPMVKVKLDGISWVITDSDVVAARATGAGIASGLGDVAVSAKYRFLKFGEEQPDPGGLAFMLVTRLPTGNRENFRGLGIVRSLGSVLFSSGKGKMRPHANGGFEWWEKGLIVPTAIAGAGLRRDQASISVRRRIGIRGRAQVDVERRRARPPHPRWRSDRESSVHRFRYRTTSGSRRSRPSRHRTMGSARSRSYQGSNGT